jgi:DNA-binding response OmpR family regulator
MNTLGTAPDSTTSPAVRTATLTLPNAAPARRLTDVEPRARILYVDDEPQLRRLGALVLVQSGYEVDTAADGAEGWDALQHAHYNLLITDHEMPRLTGLELATRARLAGMRLPIVLTSGSGAVLRDSSVKWLEIAACLPKPFGADTLVETVEKTLRAANNLRQCSGAMMDILVRLAEIRPYRHGGINE